MKTLQVTKSFWLWTALGAVLFVMTVWSRFYGLEFKPLHFDESINGWFVMKMHTNGFYKYDPNNFHGPLHFYLLQVFEIFWGSSLRVLRSLPNFFSIATVMLFAFPLTAKHKWSRLTAIFLLLSPAMIFFGRSGIHEMPFVFFQVLFAVGVIRWFEEIRDNKTAAMLLVGLFGLVTLKETFAIFLFSVVVAMLILDLRELRQAASPTVWRKIWNTPTKILLALLLLLFIGLFSGFGRNWAGLFDFVRAFLPWLKTGVHGAGHNKEFGYWFHVLWQAEPLALLGIAASFVGLFSATTALRWLSAMGLVQLLVYSWIPYKTVWCILSLIWPFYLVLGMTIERMWETRHRLVAGAVAACLLFIAICLGFQRSWSSVYSYPIDLEHPFVYVNSTYEFQEINDGLNQAMKDHPELRQKLMQMGGREQWPWPWALRRSEAMNFTLCRNQILQEAFVYICDSDEASKVEDQLTEPYLKWVIPLRQQQLDSVVYMKAAIFSDYFPGREVVGPSAKK